jgi:hypothetical protein
MIWDMRRNQTMISIVNCLDSALRGKDLRKKTLSWTGSCNLRYDISIINCPNIDKTREAQRAKKTKTRRGRLTDETTQTYRKESYG